MRELSHQMDYNILNVSNDEITPVSEMECKDNQNLLYLMSTYVKKSETTDCPVIYPSQSFYKTPKDIRLNCSHYCIYEFPSSR